MLKDITIGQHFPGNSPVHKLDPRLKIVLTVAFVVVLFMSTNFVGLFLSAVFTLSVFKLSGIPLKMLQKSIKPLIPLIFFTVFLNLFFIKGPGDPLLNLGFVKIYKEAILFIIIMVCRIIFLICGTSLLTYTTSPIMLTDGLESLMKPLNKIHFPVHEMAMMMTIALRFIPTLIEETDKIMSAQKARGADMESGGLLQRVRALIPILIPLFVSSFRRAYDLAMAMECRCYQGGEGRTRMKQLRTAPRDWVALGVYLLVAAAIVAINILT